MDSLSILTHLYLVDHHYDYDITEKEKVIFYFPTFPDATQHIIYLDMKGVTYYDPNSEQMESEKWEHFKSPEDVLKWVYGWINK